MKYLIYWFLALSGLFLICFNKAQFPVEQNQRTPREVLQAVKARYQSRNTLEVHARNVSHITLSSKLGKRHRSNHSYLHLVCKLPGQVRIETKGKKAQRVVE